MHRRCAQPSVSGPLTTSPSQARVARLQAAAGALRSRWGASRLIGTSVAQRSVPPPSSIRMAGWQSSRMAAEGCGPAQPPREAPLRLQQVWKLFLRVRSAPDGPASPASVRSRPAVAPGAAARPGGALARQGMHSRGDRAPRRPSPTQAPAAAPTTAAALLKRQRCRAAPLSDLPIFAPCQLGPLG